MQRSKRQWMCNYMYQLSCQSLLIASRKYFSNRSKLSYRSNQFPFVTAHWSFKLPYIYLKRHIIFKLPTPHQYYLNNYYSELT